MLPQSALAVIDRQRWLDRAGSGLQAIASRALDRKGPVRRRVKNALHGTWLGHPFHPALTDIPLGAWTAAVLLDGAESLSGRRPLGEAADAAIAVGLIGAVAAAVTGLNDWQHTDYGPRRTGVMHALINVGASTIWAGALVARRAGARRLGRALSAAGYVTVVSGAWLGGHLVFEDRIGTDHSAGHEPPAEYTPVLDDAALGEGELRRVEANGTPILLARLGGQIHAIAETCSHLGGPLAQGRRDGESVVCPWHASRFDLRTGRVLDGPATFPQPCFAVRMRDGRIEVRRRPE